jgi:hypothetical protein
MVGLCGCFGFVLEFWKLVRFVVGQLVVMTAVSVGVSIGLSVSGVELSAMQEGDVILHQALEDREAENMA